MGVLFRIGEHTVSPVVSVVVLIGTALLFYALSVWNLTRKSKELQGN